MPTSEDDMSIREIARTIADFRQEFRSQVAQLVRTDVYRAELAAVVARIASLEKSAERDEVERSAKSRQLTGAIVLGISSLVVALIVAAIGLS